MQTKVQMKLEQIARLRVAGVADTTIAQQLGISYGGLTRIIALPEYKECESRIHSKVLGVMDSALEDNRVALLRRAKVEQLQEEIRDAIPDALKNVLDAVRTKRDLRASFELLDRDPDCVAIKRSKANIEATQQRPSGTISQSVLNNIRKDAEATREILIKSGTPVQQEAHA